MFSADRKLMSKMILDTPYVFTRRRIFFMMKQNRIWYTRMRKTEESSLMRVCLSFFRVKDTFRYRLFSVVWLKFDLKN